MVRAERKELAAIEAACQAVAPQRTPRSVLGALAAAAASRAASTAQNVSRKLQDGAQRNGGSREREWHREAAWRAIRTALCSRGREQQLVTRVGDGF